MDVLFELYCRGMDDVGKFLDKVVCVSKLLPPSLSLSSYLSASLCVFVFTCVLVWTYVCENVCGAVVIPKEEEEEVEKEGEKEKEGER